MFESNADFEIDETLFQDVSNSQPNDSHESKTSRDVETDAFETSRIAEHTKNLLDKIHNVGRSGHARKLQRRTSSLEKLVLQRKFPGPAGLLPERHANVEYPEEETENKDEEICSQGSLRCFDDQAWSKMRGDYRKLGGLLEKYNIDWVKCERPVNQKAPFLAAAIKSIECTNSKMPMIILKDDTGDISAAIVYDLYEEFAEKLTVGSVIVLRQFGVLTTNNGTKHHITITSNNLVTIYSVDSKTNENDVNNSQCDSLERKTNKVTVVLVQNIVVDDLLSELNEIGSRYKTSEVTNRFTSGNNGGDFCHKLKLNKIEIEAIHDINTWTSSDEVRIKDILNLKQARHTRCDANVTDPKVSILGGNCDDFGDLQLNFDDFSEEFCEVDAHMSNHGDKVNPIENNNHDRVHKTINDSVPLNPIENRKFKFKSYDCNQTEDLLGLISNKKQVDEFNNENDVKSSTCFPFQVDENLTVNCLEGNASSVNNLQSEEMSKKRKKSSCKDKLKMFKFRPKDIEVALGLDEKANVYELNSNLRDGRTRQIIDCSQISVVGSKNDDCDVLKDVFHGLDASVLFDDF